MPQHRSEDSSHHDQKRVEAFLDCIAYLMAKRWLRDQRQHEEKPEENRKSRNEEV
jgi:hypothetical protein